MKIRLNSRTYTARTHTAGLHFATYATARIGSREFRSRDCPYGFTAAAFESLRSKVLVAYPSATVIDD
jgi:hypothetical protein